MAQRTRRFMLSAAPILAASTAIASPANAAPTEAHPAGPFRVERGAGRKGPPLQIMGQDFVATKISGADVAGRYTTIVLSTPAGRGPALHIHDAQNEWFFLLEGSIGLQCGEERTVLRPGDSFLAPLGVPHAYVTLGTQTARIMNLFDPAGDIEAFFAEYAGVLNAPGRPDNARLDALSERHGMKVVGPPLKAADFAV